MIGPVMDERGARMLPLPIQKPVPPIHHGIAEGDAGPLPIRNGNPRNLTPFIGEPY
jgi:hypothetical protein